MANTRAGERVKALSRAIVDEFEDGQLPNWIMARIEAKVLAKLDEEDRLRGRLREIRGKRREKTNLASI